MAKKKDNKMLLIIAIAILLLFILASKEKVITTEDGEEEITDSEVKSSGGGGGSGGVPPNGDPDEPCENCDLFWVENALSNAGPGFNIPEYLTRDGRLVPANNNPPAGHWECRGDCPDKNGNKQICKPRPKIIPGFDFNNRPMSKLEIEMECYCTLEDPCHIEFGNIFCERGIPEDRLLGILSSSIDGQYMGIAYSKIREHCRIATCEGGCSQSGDSCIMLKADDGTAKCECQSDTCHKELNILPAKADIVNNIDYNLLNGGSLKVNDFTDMSKLQLGSLSSNFRCAGNCIDSNKRCLKEGNDCICKTPEGPMPMPQPCSAVEVNGDSEWWKCLRGYCDQVPFCYAAGVPTPGWYMGSTFLKADNNCAGATAYCSAIGTRSQGWYSSYDDRLITYDNACDKKSPCFYNTVSNSCECSPYTSNCAWKVDWGSFSGQMSESNKPDKYCSGNCPYQLNIENVCQKTSTEFGEECKCSGTPTQDPCASICVNLGRNYKTGRTIQSYSECTNTVEEPYTDSSGRMCCCSFDSSGQDKCVGICQSGGFVTGWTVSSFSECDDPYVGYTQNYVDLCCCTQQGTSDMDNDGIPDNSDNCPSQPGTRLNNGCPLTKTTFSRLRR